MSAIKPHYFCRKLGGDVTSESHTIEMYGKKTIHSGLNCEYDFGGRCRVYRCSCKPFKQLQKDTRYENRKLARSLAKCTIVSESELEKMNKGREGCKLQFCMRYGERIHQGIFDFYKHAQSPRKCIESIDLSGAEIGHITRQIAAQPGYKHNKPFTLRSIKK